VSVAVVGGGVTGLAAAYRLVALGHEVVVYEAGPRVGGVVYTERRDGYLAEAGPNSLASPEPPVQSLLEDLGLAGRLVEAAPAARNRYIVRGGRLVRLPGSLRDLLGSEALSLRARLALLREPFVARGDASIEESVGQFVTRRLGSEFLDYAAGPFVGGIYAGDPAALSVRHALPRLYDLEQEHGSIIRGAIALVRRARASAPPAAPRSAQGAARIVSLAGGMGEIPVALAARLGDRVRTSAGAEAIARRGSGWSVRGGGFETQHDAVVLACPAHVVASLQVTGEGAAGLAKLGSIPYAPVGVVVLGFRRTDVVHPLDGFGALVPAVEHRRILGVLFSSTVFPARAPDGHVTLTTFVGGTRRPELAALDPDRLVTLVREELADLLGARGDPTFQQVVRWPRAIPQYVVGYGRWLDLMDHIEAANPGLFLAGSYRGGVALGDALRGGLNVAARVAGAA
jgi:oxygen-dependent protoporphyrinogen oxidase